MNLKELERKLKDIKDKGFNRTLRKPKKTFVM